MPTPDFYIIGAPKSGASTIAAWLRDHADVYIPEEELTGHFHADELRSRQTDAHVYTSTLDLGEGRLTGEISSWYLASDSAIPHILAENPDAKFIVCLRDPAEIAWILHRDNLFARTEHVQDFNTAWAMGFARRQGRGIRGAGDPALLDYASICTLGNQIARLFSRVPPAQIQIVFLEDLRDAACETFQQVETFLGLTPMPRSNHALEDFLVERPFPLLNRITRPLWRGLQKLFPTSQIMARLVFRMSMMNCKPGALYPLPQDTRQKISDRMSEDIATLSVLTGRDLTHWLA